MKWRRLIFTLNAVINDHCRYNSLVFLLEQLSCCKYKHSCFVCLTKQLQAIPCVDAMFCYLLLTTIEGSLWGWAFCNLCAIGWSINQQLGAQHHHCADNAHCNCANIFDIHLVDFSLQNCIFFPFCFNPRWQNNICLVLSRVEILIA